MLKVTDEMSRFRIRMSDPGFLIRIRTKMSRILNTAYRSMFPLRPNNVLRKEIVATIRSRIQTQGAKENGRMVHD